MNASCSGAVLIAVALLGCTTTSPSPSALDPQRGAYPQLQAAALLSADVSAARQLNQHAIHLAQRGQLQEALSLWDQALALDPYSARVHNNRGYALMLSGRLDEARVSLNLALSINPPSSLAGANLALLSRLQRQAELASLGEAQAPGTQEMTAIQRPDEQPVDPATGDNHPRLVVIGPQVYALRDASVQTRTPAIEAWGGSTQNSAQTLAAIRAARLEISNGVGVRLLAKRTSLKLAEQGVVTQRLTNTPGFAQAVTELQFNPKQEVAALALSALLPAAPELRLQAQVDHVRLVLGHDDAGRAVQAWLAGDKMDLLAASQRRVTEMAQFALTPLNEGWQWL